MNLEKLHTLNIMVKCTKAQAFQLTVRLKNLGYYWFNKTSLYPSCGFYSETNYIIISAESNYLTICSTNKYEEILLINYEDMIELLNNLKE